MVKKVPRLSGFIKTEMHGKIKPANKVVVFVTESHYFLDFGFF